MEDLDRHLLPGVWDIPEPYPARCPVVDFARVDFALVPALAVDGACYRLGTGPDTSTSSSRGADRDRFA